MPCWWVGWWLWRAGCISQDTYLLYGTWLQSLSYFCITISNFFRQAVLAISSILSTGGQWGQLRGLLNRKEHKRLQQVHPLSAIFCCWIYPLRVEVQFRITLASNCKSIKNHEESRWWRNNGQMWRGGDWKLMRSTCSLFTSLIAEPSKSISSSRWWWWSTWSARFFAGIWTSTFTPWLSAPWVTVLSGLMLPFIGNILKVGSSIHVTITNSNIFASSRSVTWLDSH